MDTETRKRLQDIIDKHAERAKTRVAVSTARKPPKAKGKNTLLLQEVHSEAAHGKWPNAFPRGVKYTAKERGLGKRLIDEFGYDGTEKVLLHVIEHWEDVRMRYRLQGYPSIALLWGYRQSLYPDILDNDGKAAQPSAGSRFVEHATSAEEELDRLLGK